MSKKVTLSDIASINMGQSPSSEHYSNDSSFTPFLQGNRTFGYKTPIFDTYCTKPIKIAQKDSILMSVRAPVGDLNIAPQDVCIGRGVCEIRPKDGDHQFLYYVLKANQKRLSNSGNGSIFNSIKRDELEKMKIVIPDDDKRNEFTETLSTIDDKHELNNMLIDDLNEYVSLLFRKWFIDFNFPNECGKPYKDSEGEMTAFKGEMIPVRWKSEALSRSIEFLNGLAMQRFPPKNIEDKLPVIKIKEINAKKFGNETEFMTQSIPSEFIVKNGDILFPWSASLSVNIWAGGVGGLNQHIFKVYSKVYENWFIFLWLKQKMYYFEKIAHGKKTTMGHINRKHLDMVEILIPDSETLARMNKVMTPLFEKIVQLNEENNYLEEMRELLIMRLID